MGKLVVFVSDWPRSREAKLSYGLRQAGWQVVLLHGHSKLPTFNASGYCAEVRPYRDCGEALALAGHYKPVVYHVFANWHFDVAAALIRRRPGKIVFDDYDVVAGMVKETFARRQAEGIATERFCLENADGVCCRSLETQHAKRRMGYKYRKRIFFPDYCWDLPNPPAKQPATGERLNVANIGNLNISQYCDVGHPSNYHLGRAVGLAYHHKITTFLYPAYWSPELQAYLEKTLAGNPHVRFANVPYEQLIHELQAMCHAGLWCTPPLDAPGLGGTPYRQTKRKHSLTNKLFDYMDAAVPVIMDREKAFQYWLVKRYHKVIDCEAFLSDPRGCRNHIQDLLANHAGELSLAREILSVRRHAKRLIEFYESI